MNQLDNTTAEQLHDTTAEQLDDTTAEQLDDTTAEQLDDTTAEKLNDTTAEQLDGTTAEQLDGTTAEQLLPFHHCFVFSFLALLYTGKQFMLSCGVFRDKLFQKKLFYFNPTDFTINLFIKIS